MKLQSLAVGAIACAMVLMPPIAEAQVIKLGLGRSPVSGDFGDEARTGWAGQATFGFSAFDLPIDFRADILYQTFSNVEREPSVWARVGGEWFRQAGVMLNATRALDLGQFQPYGLVGVGLLREWHGDYSYSGTDHVGLNFNVGVGVDIQLLDRLGFFMEARGLISNKALPLSRPAVNPEIKFRSIPLIFGIRL
jgi:hypothetical protein